MGPTGDHISIRSVLGPFLHCFSIGQLDLGRTSIAVSSGDVSSPIACGLGSFGFFTANV